MHLFINGAGYKCKMNLYMKLRMMRVFGVCEHNIPTIGNLQQGDNTTPPHIPNKVSPHTFPFSNSHRYYKACWVKSGGKKEHHYCVAFISL